VELLDAYPARLVLPCHDGSIQALRSRRADLEKRTFLPLASEAALDIAVDKTEHSTSLYNWESPSLKACSSRPRRTSLRLSTSSDVRRGQADPFLGASKGLGSAGCIPVMNLDEAKRIVGDSLPQDSRP